MEISLSFGDCIPKQQLFERYKTEVLGVSVRERRLAAMRMYDQITEFLYTIEPKYRFSPTMDQLFTINIRAYPMWNLTDAAKTFRHFENYAWNLLAYPWKREFWTIRAYSGFYKTQIEPFIHSSELLFSLIGYKFNQDNATFELIDQPVSHNSCVRVAKAAFEFFIAESECKILHEIYKAVSLSSSVTVADVYRCRSWKCGSADVFIKQLGGNCRRDLTGIENTQQCWRCKRCSTENSLSRDVCESCHFEITGYLVPQSIVKIEANTKTNTLPVITTRFTGPSSLEDIVDGTVKLRDSIKSERDSHRKTVHKSDCTADGIQNQGTYNQYTADLVIKKPKHCQFLWLCSHCAAENPAINKVCLICNVAKSNASAQSAATQRNSQEMPVELRQMPTQKHSLSTVLQSSIIRDAKSHQASRETFLDSSKDRGLAKSDTVNKLLRWTCCRCSVENSVDTDVCHACGGKQTDAGSHNPRLANANSDTKCLLQKPAVQRVEEKTTTNPCSLEAVKSEKLALWQCAWCTYANHAKKDRCKICQNPINTRPADAR